MIGVPPGRAGRRWLRHRLDTATRAAGLLERKLRALRQQQQLLSTRAAEAEQLWLSLARAADQWLLRAALVGGQRSLTLATPRRPATVEITWATRMGVRYPADAVLHPPSRTDRGAEVDSGATQLRADQAVVSALRAAGRHAAAQAALRAVGAEVAATQQRLQALDRRWIPRLSEALHTLELALEEQEHAEDVIRHRATDLTR